MRILPATFLLLFLLLPSSFSYAASNNFSGHVFNAYIESSSPPELASYDTRYHHDRRIYVQEGQEYSIVVNNPLPVRVGVVVTVDGLNTINGKSTTPAKGAKWVIKPYSSISISGWQTGNSNLRKFVFRRPEYTYAKWRENTERRSYSQNLGVIGIAYFWDASELYHALSTPPRRCVRCLNDKLGRLPESESIRKRKSYDAYGGRAGTGMGAREYHPVYSVAFNFNAGMYSVRDTLTIHYAFRRPIEYPRPFRDEPYRYHHPQFTPEMPQY